MFNNRPAFTNNGSSSASQAKYSQQSNDGYGKVNADVYHIRDRVQRKLLTDTEGDVNRIQTPQMRQTIEAIFNQVLVEENLLYTRSVRTQLLDWVLSDILGYGPLEPILDDNSITEIMVNGPDIVYIERNGKIELSNITFENNAHLMRIIEGDIA